MKTAFFLLRKLINDNAISELSKNSETEWGCAGGIISIKNRPHHDYDSFAVTPHVREIAWLLNTMRDCGYEFQQIERWQIWDIANFTVKQINKGSANLNELLLAIVDEAERLVNAETTQDSKNLSDKNSSEK